LKGTLREYQQKGLDWLINLYEQNLNGILADQMGLGKTIQTISLLAYLACEKEQWGPSLVIVPTSVLLNWEMELKKWCPALKVLSYYGTIKERKLKRMGWSKEDSFHVCVTSYSIALSDHLIFKRKRWLYMILDEAHHIKNFKSQRWQVLLNFQAEHRLLLTGTPLQNSVMELWSLMHFLMPTLFSSHQAFQEWFYTPFQSLIESSGEKQNPNVNATTFFEKLANHSSQRLIVQKLHTVLRPFILRRLKTEVEKQMPSKFEHIVYCSLSNRQKVLYDEFMSRAKTKEAIASGRFLSIIFCLMQLRKVCNHPDLFETRLIASPLVIGNNSESSISCNNLYSIDYDYLSKCNLIRKEGYLEGNDLCLLENHTAFEWFRMIAMLPKFDGFMSKFQVKGDMSLHKSGVDINAEFIKKYQMAVKFRKDFKVRQKMIYLYNRNVKRSIFGIPFVPMIQPLPERKVPVILEYNIESYERFMFVTRRVIVINHQRSSIKGTDLLGTGIVQPVYEKFYPLVQRQVLSFPDKNLIQFDCGKLQVLDGLLGRLKAENRRVLIFTQMSKMLDILEIFLNIKGHSYYRLDGGKKTLKWFMKEQSLKIGKG
jgi:helicase SWR1